MKSEKYLDLLAKKILNDYETQLSDVVLILPNKRAKIFFIESLKAIINTPIFIPNILTIEDFIQEIASIQRIDSISLLFEFFEVYQNVNKSKQNQSFETFSNWAKILLQDFNDIDLYLLNPSQILSYLKDIEDIKRWGIDVSDKTKLLENYIDFWKQLPTYYSTLYNQLKLKKIGYQGLVSREAFLNIENFSKANKNKIFIFAGFNALNATEEKITQYLLANNHCNIYWDIEQTFLNDSFHDAGLFQRRFKKEWKYYNSHAFEWIFDEFTKQKEIKIIGTAKSIGQAKIAGNIIDDILKKNPNAQLNNTAIVLGDENLLLPLLNSLPKSVENLNITMGFTSTNNPAQQLILKIFKMHINAIKRNSSQYVFYYKDILAVLSNPLIEKEINTKDLQTTIHKNNITFVRQDKIKDYQQNKSELFEMLFNKWPDQPLSILATLQEILIIIRNNLNENEDKIIKTFVYSIYKTINKVSSYFEKNKAITSITTLHEIYKQTADIAEISFEGEPLKGLQIMGVLESRVLDFETVIITGVNEGNFPAGKKTNSFIPFDIKREKGLPTYKEKDAIYTYHFYHLLQRSRNIFLIYNTDSDGFDSGEKSRFITQLEYEKQQNHNITHEIYSATLPENDSKIKVIKKSASVLNRLAEINEKGFSPTSLTSYIRNPLDFYFQKILFVKETDVVEENIALNTLGTIIHESLEALYKPYVGHILTETHLRLCLEQYETEVLKQFKLIYKEGEVKKGKNLIAFEVAKRNILNFLNLEIDKIKQGDIVKILFLEKECSKIITNPTLPFPVKIAGKVDRIEERNGKIRIIDYKTGKVEAKNITLKTWENLTLEVKNDKIIQILCYALMFQSESNNKEIEAGILSFKNLKSGYIPFEFTTEKGKTSIINADILNDFEEELVKLLNTILDPEIPFEEKTT